MKLLSFLLEHERSTRVSRLPLETSRNARLRLTAIFWDPGFEEHVFEVVTEQPDGTERVVASETRAAMRESGPFEVTWRLEPLEQAGWHRLYLRVDGLQDIAMTQVHVLGPRRTPIVRYKGREATRTDATPSSVTTKRRA
jgi:hypothetical protein